MKDKHANTSGNTQKGGVNSGPDSPRPATAPKGQGSQRESGLILMHPEYPCEVGCGHATFIQGYRKGKLVLFIICAGGGYKAITKYKVLLDPSSAYVDYQNRIDDE